MNTLQLEKILNTDEITRNYFIGVYSRDQLPILRDYPCCFILNTDPSTQPGEHWLALYYNEDIEAEFFDPAGYHPSMYGLEDYLKSTAKSWIYNKKRIQGYFSELCGQYCLFYLYCRCRNYSLLEFTNQFSFDANKNDDIINEKLKLL